MARWCTSEQRVIAVASPFGWAWVHPWRPQGHWGGVAVLDRASPPEGESTAVQTLVDALPSGVDLEWFSTSPGRALAPPNGYTMGAAEDWAFYAATETPAAVDSGRRWEQLDDDADAAELQAFGQAEHRHFQGFPGRGVAYRWYGLRDRTGALVAIGALQRLATGAPHLGGIVVRREARGKGIGRELAALLTREAVASGGVATLGAMSANLPARRLYESLGYRLARRMVTRTLTRTDEAGR